VLLGQAVIGFGFSVSSYFERNKPCFADNNIFYIVIFKALRNVFLASMLSKSGADSR